MPDTTETPARLLLEIAGVPLECELHAAGAKLQAPGYAPVWVNRTAYGKLVCDCSEYRFGEPCRHVRACLATGLLARANRPLHHNTQE